MSPACNCGNTWPCPTLLAEQDAERQRQRRRLNVRRAWEYRHQWEQAMVERDAALQRFERLLAGLRKLEAIPDTTDPPWFYCPVCDMYTSAPLRPDRLGHAPDCWLADLIREAEGV